MQTDFSALLRQSSEGIGASLESTRELLRTENWGDLSVRVNGRQIPIPNEIRNDREVQILSRIAAIAFRRYETEVVLLEHRYRDAPAVTRPLEEDPDRDRRVLLSNGREVHISQEEMERLRTLNADLERSGQALRGRISTIGSNLATPITDAVVIPYMAGTLHLHAAERMRMGPRPSPLNPSIPTTPSLPTTPLGPESPVR